MYSPVGPTVGAPISIGLGEALRAAFGTEFTGAAAFPYGVLLALLMPAASPGCRAAAA